MKSKTKILCLYITYKAAGVLGAGFGGYVMKDNWVLATAFIAMGYVLLCLADDYRVVRER